MKVCRIVAPVLLLAFVLACGGDPSLGNTLDNSGTGNGTNTGGGTTGGSSEAALRVLFPESEYLALTKDSKGDLACVEGNAVQLGIPSKPASEWYYTYENMISAMAKVPNFAGEGDRNTRRLEIAAFMANIAQETGNGRTYGAGCAIQEGYGSAWGSPNYTQGGKPGRAAAGYIGRGPHQLSWNYNYKNFSEALGLGDQLLNDPDRLTKEPAIGIAGSLWFWNRPEPKWNGSLNPPFKPSAHNVIVDNWQPTAKDLVAGRTKERYFGVIINLINGGVECGRASPDVRAMNRVRYFKAYAKDMNVTLPYNTSDNDLSCYNQQNFAVAPSSP